MRSPLRRKRLWAWLARSFVVVWVLLALFAGPPALTLAAQLVLAVVGAIIMAMGLWNPSPA
jgi:hypothetical protein